ncbi:MULTISPECIES: ectoine/hydroxyectoine ABC transporter permease subunit EhuC [unclassified Streptomyces]|uniref:ectoine/hydroxyectoine ABC transporter permease subunit EhuC n=1 Tax=unclassified Streptomyces TaxID=2593676 RepID=UPI00224F9EF7|nr:MULTISPECIES: ectoine/hydroxyectoine ABC transporter permease subunit EhuC [unclassified Streptomyces]MCX5437532.1 ectoine/hydroxyectoine ABC transporter permease subunit EhuC [Streptomyces sp. NBC_00063]WSE15214.1 ectoine/hydroxyectoine ABC transporter permease subunit EhuC [Streptomyces sp. NBC_01397]WUB95867.1 ectoine/hydroxyectoine ABC transporter permease subunit EhuC [Streptomyces sp. NBC_00569]
MTAGLWEHWVLPGIWITIQLTVYSAALATVVAFGVGMARTHRLKIVRFLAGFYTEVFRGTSALILMFWIFFVLPQLAGWSLVPMWAAVLALGLSYGAYGAEVVRGALNAVAPAQREAGVALSFTPWQRMRLILLPQAVPEMIPPFSNLLVELLKGTALVSLLGIGDVSFAAYLVRLATQESAQIYAITLVIYFVIAFLLTRGMRALERKTKAGLGRRPDPGTGLMRKLNIRQTTETAPVPTSAGGGGA